MTSNNPNNPNNPSVTQDLLSRAHSPDSAARIFAEKIQHRPLFLKPSSPPPPDPREARRRARREKQAKRAKTLKPKPLSARRRRALGLHDIPKNRKDGCRYATFEPLNRLWVGYVREILGGGEELYTGGQGAAAKLCAADFHGAKLEVTRSQCPSRVGLRGIVVKDSRFVFEIVTEMDQVKVLPKEGTVFRVDVPVGNGKKEDGEGKMEGEEEAGGHDPKRKTFTFEIHGDQFQHRSADRTNKKFKAHFLKHL